MISTKKNMTTMLMTMATIKLRMAVMLIKTTMGDKDDAVDGGDADADDGDAGRR